METQHTQVLSLECELKIDQSKDFTSVPIDDAMDHYCVNNRRMGEVLLTAAEMNQTAASPKPSPSRVTAHKTGNLEDTAQPAGHSSG